MKLTANCATWLSIDCCCDSYSNTLTLLDPNSSQSNNAYLVDEDRLSKVLNKFDGRLRVLCFIEDPGRLPLSQQRLGSSLDVFQGSTDGWLGSRRQCGCDTYCVNLSRLSASSRLPSALAAVTPLFNLINQGISSPSLASMSLLSWDRSVSEARAQLDRNPHRGV